MDIRGRVSRDSRTEPRSTVKTTNSLPKMAAPRLALSVLVLMLAVVALTEGKKIVFLPVNHLSKETK